MALSEHWHWGCAALERKSLKEGRKEGTLLSLLSKLSVLIVWTHSLWQQNKLLGLFHILNQSNSFKPAFNFQRWKPPPSPLLALCTFLVSEKHAGDRSLWKPYLEILPKAYTCPVCLEPEVVNLLPKSLKAKAEEQRAHVQEFFASSRDFFSSLQPLFVEAVESIFSYSALLWAWCTVNTRAVYLRPRRRECLSAEPDTCALAPYLDLLNHSPRVQVRRWQGSSYSIWIGRLPLPRICDCRWWVTPQGETSAASGDPVGMACCQEAPVVLPDPTVPLAVLASAHFLHFALQAYRTSCCIPCPVFSSSLWCRPLLPSPSFLLPDQDWSPACFPALSLLNLVL